MNTIEWSYAEKDWPTIYVDVDHTLIMWDGAMGHGGKPNAALISKLREHKKTAKSRLYVWSYGGELHARNAVKFCQIEDIVDGCLAKPMMIVDDDVTFPHPRVAVERP